MFIYLNYFALSMLIQTDFKPFSPTGGTQATECRINVHHECSFHWCCVFPCLCAVEELVYRMSTFPFGSLKYPSIDLLMVSGISLISPQHIGSCTCLVLAQHLGNGLVDDSGVEGLLFGGEGGVHQDLPLGRNLKGHI